MSTIAERVASGAALLDERMPGWHQRIDLDTLDIDSCKNCVLGQIYGSPQMEVSFDPGLGFDIDDADYRFASSSRQRVKRLTVAWRELIESRRAAP